MDGWISVKDRLPADGSVVLATGFEYNNENGNRFYLVSLFSNGFRHYIQNSERWSDDGSDYITHWMPIPEAPVASNNSLNLTPGKPVAG